MHYRKSILAFGLLTFFFFQSCAISFSDASVRSIDSFTKIALSKYEETTVDIWEVVNYADNFGEPTGEYFLRPSIPLKGIFSNSVTNNADLYGTLMIDDSGISIALVEYGSYIVKGNSYEKAFTISIRHNDGTTKNLGRYTNYSDRITISKSYAQELFMALAEGKEFKIYLEESNYGDFALNTNTYLLTVPATQGFSMIYIKTFSPGELPSLGTINIQGEITI